MNVKSRLILLAAACLTVPACAHLEPDRVAADFGNSVRVATRGQLADPEAARDPGSAPVTGLDGPRGTAIFRALVGDNSRRDLGDASVDTNSVTSSAN